MKKLLLFLVLAVTFNISAQISTTYFAKPLELNSVPASTTKADSVIVRGADKILKYVPRSEFGGGGGSQNLQQTLDNGGTATSIANFSVSGSNGSVSLTQFGAEISNNAYGQLAITENGIVIQNRGNSNPIQIRGNSAGVNIAGSMGAQLEMPNSGVVKLHSNQGLNINNYSSDPLNIYSTTKTTIQGIDGLELRSQSQFIDMIAPKVEMFGNGQSNKVTTNDESGKVAMTSISGGVAITSSGGPIEVVSSSAPVAISNTHIGRFSISNSGVDVTAQNAPINIKTAGSSINIGDESVTAPIMIKTGTSPISINTGGVLSTSAGMQFFNSTLNGGSIAINGDINLNAGDDKNINLNANNASINIGAKDINLSGQVSLMTGPVSNLPALPSGNVYATVTDALNPVNNQPVVGGGAEVVPVFYNGTAWVSLVGTSGASTSNYRVYRALLSQSGTNAPTAIVLENTLGGEVIWSRDAAGIYMGHLVGATYVADKTFITTGRTISNFYCVAKPFTNYFFVGSVDKDVTGGTDGFLNKMPVEIIVYN